MSMKVAKRKPKKSAGKSKAAAESQDDSDTPGKPSLLLEGMGLLLLSVCLLTIISLMSSFVSPEVPNFLGPYLGNAWAELLNQSVGSLPVLFLLAAVATLGFKLMLARGGLRVRIVLALSLLFLAVGVLLSIRNIHVTHLSPRQYQLSGGYLGNFLVQKMLLPVFGVEQFGPYLVTVLALLFILIWGFRMSVVALSERSASSVALVLRPFYLGLSKLWAKPPAAMPETDPYSAGMENEASTRNQGNDKGNMRKALESGTGRLTSGSRAGTAAEEANVNLRDVSVRDAALRATALRPAALRRDASLGSAAEGATGRSPAARRRGGNENSDATSPVPMPLPLKNGVGTDKTSLSRGESDREDEEEELDLNDPLAVRRSRDLNLERKRVSELNEWEVKSRSPEIAGLLLREKAKAEKSEKDRDPARQADMSGKADAAADGEPTGDGSQDGEKDSGKAPQGAHKGKKRGADPEVQEANRNEDSETSEAEAGAIEMERDWEAEALAKVAAGDGRGNDGADDGVTDALPGESLRKVSKGPVKSIPKPPPKPEVKYDPYRVPGLDEIFDEPPKQPLEFTEEELREQSKLLEDQLINFKVMGKVTQICPGPVITRYEVELAPGVKVSRISTLADDLALALRAKSIRILAPIPGKSVVGIEVPNRKAQIVYIKEILRAPEFAFEEDTLKVCLGKSIAGEPYVMDLTRAPHLLIAGQTGSGKSVCINSIMASFLCSKTPDELRMILVDPKVVELKPYDSIPHLLYPVITQPDVAVAGLKWATFEMDRRYEVLAQCGVRNIKGFNGKVREGKLPDSMDDEDKRLLPYIVIIIDELADLMMVAGKEVETNIARIAQKARAVGIHLILATQRPSTNVITGTIKANLPTRIAFQVASQIDARTIMDKMGAEKLLGRGDMLFRPIEFPEPVRLHGCYLDDAQAEKLALVCSEQHVNYPQIQSFNLEDDPASAGGKDEPRDEKFREAAELVVQVKQASVSLLQRRLGIGYARSGRLVDQLERAGIVGRERGSKPREVLMDADTLHSFLSSGLNDD